MKDIHLKILEHLYKNDNGNYIDVSDILRKNDISSSDQIDQFYKSIKEYIDIDSIYNYRGLLSLDENQDSVNNNDTIIRKIKITSKGREYYLNIQQRRNSFSIMVFTGIIVSACTIFILTPLKDFVTKKDNIQSASLIDTINIPNDTKKNDSIDVDTLISDTSIKVDNIYYMQSYSPIEVFNNDLIITLNNSISYVNQEIILKIVQKSTGETKIANELHVGDIISFNNIMITLLSLDKNISTYDLLIRVENRNDTKRYSQISDK